MNVLIVDDEELARRRLRTLLAAHADVTVAGEAANGHEAIEKIAHLRPDVVFLDIKMPVAGGLDVVRSLGSRRPKIVFCTAYDEFAVEAFELHAVDYLLKPVTRARLASSIEHLRRTRAEDWDAPVERLARAGAPPPTHFLGRSGARFRVIAAKDVEYFSFDDGITILHTGAGRFTMDPTLSALERHLDAGRFFRISRRVIVKLNALLEVAPLVGGHGEVQLRDGTRFPVSRRRFRALLARLGARGPAVREPL